MSSVVNSKWAIAGSSIKICGKSFKEILYVSSTSFFSFSDNFICFGTKLWMLTSNFSSFLDFTSFLTTFTFFSLIFLALVTVGFFTGFLTWTFFFAIFFGLEIDGFLLFTFFIVVFLISLLFFTFLIFNLAFFCFDSFFLTIWDHPWNYKTYGPDAIRTRDHLISFVRKTSKSLICVALHELKSQVLYQAELPALYLAKTPKPGLSKPKSLNLLDYLNPGQSLPARKDQQILICAAFPPGKVDRALW